MEATNVLKVNLSDGEYDALSSSICILDDLEKVVREHLGYEYTRDVFHETRCKLMKIQQNRIIYDDGNYHITRKENTTSAPSAADIEKRDKNIKALGKKLYKFAEETETLYDPCRDEKKPTVKEFSESLNSYRMTAYLMESLLQGMDESGEDLPKYYEVMMDLIHHMERNDLEKGD